MKYNLYQKLKLKLKFDLQLKMAQARSENLHELNEDCLEKIFTKLEFKDLMSAELTCKAWKRTIDNRYEV